MGLPRCLLGKDHAVEPDYGEMPTKSVKKYNLTKEISQLFSGSLAKSPSRAPYGEGPLKNPLLELRPALRQPGTYAAAYMVARLRTTSISPWHASST